MIKFILLFCFFYFNTVVEKIERVAIWWEGLRAEGGLWSFAGIFLLATLNPETRNNPLSTPQSFLRDNLKLSQFPNTPYHLTGTISIQYPSGSDIK